jgi:BirA family biotin operon repressor/biotin-[acetyl-CoA-carboxylase] ligase
MRFVKLDAIDSTNDFLKNLSQSQAVENFTVVSAENQTKGKGQMGSVWTSEPGKNLTMSVLIKDVLTNVQSIFGLNAAVAISVIEVLEMHAIPKTSVKWPNDIMSGNKKIGGILIENSFRNDGSIESIVGLGLNVNQTDFELLPQASSLALAAQRSFDKELLLVEIAQSIQKNAHDLASAWNRYIEILFRKGMPTTFENLQGTRFMGIIVGVESDGKLKLQLEDDSFVTFGIKEIRMLY